MSQSAKASDLLYVSNSTGTVSVFTWPGLNLVGSLTDFQEPAALCVDKTQDVYVVDFSAQAIYEYAHGGTTPIQTLADPGGNPNACSVDPVTGNLAVTNQIGYTESSGNLEIYPQATGTPDEYTDPAIFAYWWPAYDDKGNLFFNGFNSGYSQLYNAEMRKGSKKVKGIALNQTFGFPGGLLWDRKYLACVDSTTNVIYQFSITGKYGTEIGSTALGGATSIFQFWIVGKNRAHPEGQTVIGADADASALEVWPYPAGGSSPTKITTQSIDFPEGAAVSFKKEELTTVSSFLLWCCGQRALSFTMETVAPISVVPQTQG
jgi:DNA-binding beta-propeller fold protein YncE